MKSFFRLLWSVWVVPAFGKFAFGAGVAYTFKQELMKGTHDFLGDTIKIALYTQAGATTLNNTSLTVYTATGEVGASGTYAAGGSALSGVSVSISTATAYVTWSSNPSWTTATITSDSCLIYNNSTKNATANRAIAIYSFGSTTSTAGTFTVVLPAAGASATLTIA